MTSCFLGVSFLLQKKRKENGGIDRGPIGQVNPEPESPQWIQRVTPRVEVGDAEGATTPRSMQGELEALEDEKTKIQDAIKEERERLVAGLPAEVAPYRAHIASLKAAAVSWSSF